MKITLLAMSSGDTPYTVDFLVEEGKLTVHCDCKAGSYGQLCKHKTELLAGDASRLYDPSQMSDLEKIQGMLAGTSGLYDAVAAIAAAEKVVREKQAEVKTLKKHFASLLSQGVEVTEGTS